MMARDHLTNGYKYYSITSNLIVNYIANYSVTVEELVMNQLQ